MPGQRGRAKAMRHCLLDTATRMAMDADFSGRAVRFDSPTRQCLQATPDPVLNGGRGYDG